MSADDLSFDQALEQLDTVRARLEEARKPEDIERLMRSAGELTARCRLLLGRAGEAIAANEAGAS